MRSSLVNRKRGIVWIAAVAAAALACTIWTGCTTRPAPRHDGMRLACQMWGVKEFWEKDPERGFAEAFPKLRAMGYEGVQSMAFW